MNAKQSKLVKVTELKENMTILSYVKFSKKYTSMSNETCKWLKHNFKGAQVVVERGGETREIFIKQLTDGDTLRRIYKFLPGHKKLITISGKLVAALKNRGFLVFKVIEQRKRPSLNQIEKRKAIVQTEEFTQRVGESSKIRENAAEAVESLMDNTRNGTTNILEMMNYVDSITDESSADVITAVAGLKKSDHVYTHCVDVGAIFQTAYLKLVEKKKITSIFKDEQEVLLSAFLHDFGKSKIPKDILESTERFEPDSREMRLIRKHPEYSVELLSKIRMPDYVINMAHFHHLKYDTTLPSSYPKAVNYKKSIFETRLLSIVDIYQALIGQREYKKSWAPPAAMQFISQLSDIEYDPEVWKDFYQVMGRFPIGSMVQLNDESQAFVTSVSSVDPDKPQVIIVRNSKGEDLEHQTFADLSVEKDLTIIKGLDNYSIFGEQSLDIFTNLRIS